MRNRDLVRLKKSLRARGHAGLGQGAAIAKEPALSPASAVENSAAAGAAPGAGEASPKPKPKFHPLQVLKGLQTGKGLTPRQLARAARALTALEIRPQLHGYKQLADQLARERGEETAGLGRLGSELQSGVSGVYGNIAGANAQALAAQQAIASKLGQEATGIAERGGAEQTKMQEGALGALTQGLQMRGAPTGGSAQQALTEAVAQQQAARSTNAGAFGQFAASQGAGNVALAGQLGGAAQLQGGAAVGGIGREITSRAGQANQKYRESIQTALGKLADVKATKGALFNKNLLTLREAEQKFSLGKAAVQGEKAKLGLEAKKAAEAERHNRAGEAASAKSAQASYINAVTNRWEAHHPGASSSEAAKHRKEVKQEVGEVKSMIPGLIAELGAPPKNRKQLNYFISKMNSKASADPSLVQHVIRNWYINSAPSTPPGR